MKFSEKLKDAIIGKYVLGYSEAVVGSDIIEFSNDDRQTVLTHWLNIKKNIICVEDIVKYFPIGLVRKVYRIKK